MSDEYKICTQDVFPVLKPTQDKTRILIFFVINIQDRTEGKLYDTVLPDICDKMKNYESVSDEGSLAGLSADRFPEEFAGNHNIVIHEENDSNMTQYEENA